MHNTNTMHLIYQNSEGQQFSQHWRDLTEMGTLVDPETGEDLELIGWHSDTAAATEVEVQAAWHAGLDAGREQGRVKDHAHPSPSAPVGVEGLMQLARNWCLAWGEWAHDADPGCAKENAAEAELRAALTAALAQQPAACPKCGGTGEADSGGIMPWGAPAMIPCDCQQPGAVEAKDAEIEALRAEVERLRQLVNGGRGPLPAGAVAWLDMSPGEASLTFDKKSDSNRANKRRVMELFHRVSAGYYPLYLEPQADRAKRLADPTATQENDDA